MKSLLQPPLAARQGQVLQVLGIARISGENQNELSLDDQGALYRCFVSENTDLQFQLNMIAGRGSGECLDREEALKATAEVQTGKYDLVIAEDLGRIFRRVHAQLFCELCEDVGTRLIALNDHVDTGQENWRVLAGFATLRHELYNADTAKRIRRSLRNRFQQGGVLQSFVYGYIKPAGARTDADLQKDPAAEPIYKEWFRRLEQKASYAEVADWLNAEGVPTGSSCRSEKWTGQMVGRVTHNKLLKGIRVRNDKVSRRINQTGRRRSVKAPPGERLERHCPHLAFFEPEYYDHVVRIADEANARYTRKGKDGVDHRKGVSKKRTTWPGQHLRCGVCNRIYYWTGVTAKKMMVCSGSHAYRCWNSLDVSGDVVIGALSRAILTEVIALPDFDPVFLEELRRQWSEHRPEELVALEEKKRRLEEVGKQLNRVADAIAEKAISPTLQKKLDSLEAEQTQLTWDCKQLQARLGGPEPKVPSMEFARRRAAEVFSDIAAADPEVGRLLRTVIPDLKVFPYQLCGGGAIVLRASFTLHLAPLAGVEAGDGNARELLRPMVVDLFSAPQHVRFREQVLALKAEGLTERQIGARLGIKQSMVQRAVALHRQMQEAGLTDPYVPLTEPPSTGRLRRHRHKRYRFEPLDEDSSAA